MDIMTGTSLSEQERLSWQIFRACRSMLYRQFPHLDAALAGLIPERTDKIKRAGTDGIRLFFSEKAVLCLYAECPQQLYRGYFHIILHCLYLHLTGAKRYEPRLWNLACDLFVERLIDRVCAGGKMSWILERTETAGTEDAREAVECWLGRELLSAEQIYAKLKAGDLPCRIEELEALTVFDDHRPWLQPEADGDGLRKKWEQIRIHAGSWGGGAEGSNAGMEAGGGRDLTGPIRPGGRFDYRRFLKQFAILQEEQELDLESFDPAYYQLGMERYGNIPLIEPLEYREVHRLSELVIAIDTSGSCNVQMVEQFLQETYRILADQENFFRKMNVYLIQCDCCVEDVKVIHSKEEWEQCSQSIVIHGRGGTDFTPVFRYVEELQKKQELTHLRALLYFTDGDGIYPRTAPDYETAFVFLKKTEGMRQAPAWARIFCVEEP